MADDGLGVGVPVMGVLEDGALLVQVAEAALAEAIVDAARQVAAQLVDGDLKDQKRWVRGLGGGRSDRQKGGG